MNKKFSTLVASFMLAVCATPVLAQEQAQDPVTPVCGAPADLAGLPFDANEGINAKLYYNLVDADGNYLSVNVPDLEKGTGFKLKVVKKNDLTNLELIDQALWKVEPQVSGDGGVVRFNFTNKATGLIVAFDSNVAANANVAGVTVSADAYNLSGSMPQWKWYDNAYNVDPVNFETPTPLSVAFANGDSTLTLGVNTDNEVYAYKYSNKTAAPNTVPAGKQLKLKIQKAGTYVMKAIDLNTKVSGAKGVKYMQLNFPNVTVDNIFAEKLQAQQLVVTPAAAPGTAATFTYNIDASKKYADEDVATPADYVILSPLDDNEMVSGKFVHVDTSYYASQGATYKLYNQIAVTNAVATMTAGVVNSYDKIATGLPLSAFRFKFTKNLANDSIWVQAGTEAVEMGGQQTAINNPVTTAYTMWDYATTGAAIENGKAEDVKNGSGKNLILSHCTLQDETKKVITFYECDEDKAVNRVNLLGADGIAYDYTSLAEGVYVITVRNSAWKEHVPGSYAFNKLCGDFGFSNQEPKIEPKHMPAYQWVVEKVVRTGAMANVSPVRIINREFVNGYFNNESSYAFQFKKGANLKENELVYNGDTLVFTKIDGVATAPYGYFNLSKEDAEHTIYNFEYLSALADGLKINVGAQDDVLGPDTILTVGQDGARFRLIPVEFDKETAIAYGYNGPVAEGKGLKRTMYKLQINDANKLGNNHKYVGSTDDVTGMERYIVTPKEANASKFYLKEQNDVDGKHFYALVEPDVVKGDRTLSFKASVDDVSAQLRVENLCGETRTSSFAIAVDSTVIYRELNGDNTIVVEPGTEPYAAPCVANFFRSRIVDKEYLFESANQGQFNEIGKGINYLGVRLEDKTFDDSTAIYVDTADLRNPFKPQYMLAVGVTVTPAGKYCPIHGFNSGCKDEHLTEVPAHVWGRYLINA